MSGPINELDAPTALLDCSDPTASCIRATDSREERLGQLGWQQRPVNR